MSFMLKSPSFNDTEFWQKILSNSIFNPIKMALVEYLIKEFCSFWSVPFHSRRWPLCISQ